MSDVQHSTLNSPFHRAVAAIQQRDWPRVRQAIQPLLAQAHGAIAATAQTELESLLGQVLAVLDDGDFHDRWDVAKLLVDSGDWAIAPLVERLQDEDADPDVRWFAARMLGDMQTPHALAPLLEVLTAAETDDLRDVAAIALTQLADRAIAPLTELMHDPATRGLAVRALAQIHQPETLPPLMVAAMDTDATIRELAVEALGRFPDACVLPRLLQALRDGSAAVRKVAVAGLALRADRGTAPALVPQISPLLYDLSLEVCCQAAIALGRCGTPEAVDHLVQGLRSPHTPLMLQLELVRTLGWLGIPEAVQGLQQLLLDPPAHALEGLLYQETIAALARSEDQTAHPQIAHLFAQLLRSNHPVCAYLPARQAMIVGLGQVGQMQDLDVLIEGLATPDRSLQLHTLFALKQLAGQRARQRLCEYLATPNLDPALHDGITVALSEWVHP